MVEEAAPVRRRRPSAHRKLLRRRRIFARLRKGLAYEEIAAEEGLTATRIRQIVSEVLQKRAVDSCADHAKLQLDRLTPAVQLGAEAIAAGDISAITPYLKALDRLDRYQTVAVAHQGYDEEDRRKLMEKINRLVENLSPRDAASDAQGEAEAADDPAALIEEQQDSQGEATQWMSV